jgi:hypothetical protein
MRLRILYFIEIVMSYLKLFKFSFSAKSYNYAGMFMHGMIYLEGQVNCKKIADSWKDELGNQRLNDFLNKGEMDLKSISYNRISHLLEFSMSHSDKEYILFSIDPSNFKKYKRKKSQKVRYTSEGKGTFLSHTFVLSSIINGDLCIPFKRIIYEGKDKLSKSRIYLKLANKFEKFNVNGLKRIAVFDGEGCKRSVLPYFHKSSNWEGFVTKFPRTRNIEILDNKIHIKKYLSNLKEEDFIKTDNYYYHNFTAKVPSLDFLGECKFLVVLEDIKDLKNQVNIRVLITDIKDLKTAEFLQIYRKRWKQETYHQIIKDRLGCRTYKFRKMKAVMRFLELGDLTYSFLEYEKIKMGKKSVSEVRNKLIDDFTFSVSKKLALEHPKAISKSA